MEDLLGALLQGGQQPSEPEDAGSVEDPLAQLLQSMMAGQAPQETAPPAEAGAVQGGLDMGDLLQGLLGGTGGQAGGTGQLPQYGAQASSDAGAGGLDMGSLLQGLLGGGGGLAAGTSPAAGTGQGMPSSAGGLADLLGSIMGGGSPTLQSDSLLGPIVNGLADKLGLPPQIAQAVVAFVLGKLMARRMQPGVDITTSDRPPQAAQPQAMSLEDVVQTMNSGQRVTKTAIRDAGLAEELAEHTGLDRATAEASLQEVLNALGGQLGTGQ